MIVKEKMFVEYKNLKGKIMFVCDEYATFTPINTSALIVIYREDWNSVTLMQVAHNP